MFTSHPWRLSLQAWIGLLILGPGQAKYELSKRIDHHKGLKGTVMAIVNAQELSEGARHVLRMLIRTDLHSQIAPVLAALEDVEPIVEVPVAAHTALDALKEGNDP